MENENVISTEVCKVQNMDTTIHNGWVHSKEGKENPRDDMNKIPKES